MSQRRFRILSRGAGIRLAVGTVLLILGLLVADAILLRMPGTPRDTARLPLRPDEQVLVPILERHVAVLAGEIGPRNLTFRRRYIRAAEYITTELDRLGYTPLHLPFEVGPDRPVNVEAVLPGRPDRHGIIVIGAHYESCFDSPAANDNASGVAATLVLAEWLRALDAAPEARPEFRFVFFANEEPPYFQTKHMGSLVYAAACRERGDDLRAVFILETMGYYRDDPGTQRYSLPGMSLRYPDRGNFLAVVGNLRSRDLARSTVGGLRAHDALPIYGAALPGLVPGVGWSDHWAFWQHGYPAVMLTDTAPWRYPYYHTPQDTPDKLRYAHLALATAAVEALVRRRINGPFPHVAPPPFGHSPNLH